MEEINISAIQIRSEIGNKEKNINKVNDIIELMPKSDVIVLPEVWNVGWACQKFIENAEHIKNSLTIEFLCDIAKRKNVNIIGGSIITKNDDGKFYNTCLVINNFGELVGIYNKNHLYSYYGCNEGKYITRGENPVIVKLGGVNFGITICYDIRFAEIYRAYRKHGADILINCAAWASTKPIPWDVMTKSRAVENQTYMVAVNQCGLMSNDEYNLGHSRIIDYNGNILSEIEDNEGFIQSKLNLTDMYKFREKCNILNDIKENYEVKFL